MYDDIFDLMGEGYGEAVFEIRKARAVEETLARLGGDMDLMYESHWSGSDDRYGDEYYPAGSAWKHISLREVLEDMVEYDHENCYKDSDGKTRWRRERRVFDFAGVESLSDVSEIFCDKFCGDDHGVGSLMTVKQVELEEQNRRRKSLERTAAEFAAQCGHKVGTREYILAARRAIEDVRYEQGRWNDGETRMEQWAACRFAGVGSEVYYDDLDFENSRYNGRLDRLGEVLDWLEEICPLLMRQMEQEFATCSDDEYADE